ncbi:uncharacterized protein RAG0_16830 [Rhynchosporium agropyri]|uniref:Uncharacterized protein n=1 Tax=Rhynchosporium agropyri TaxID=914238 RepID=A0A1E1LS49_9HELO|nr:uncharacterized protein RAG0_16830 [Rhynchosporium agropyri]
MNTSLPITALGPRILRRQKRRAYEMEMEELATPRFSPTLGLIVINHWVLALAALLNNRQAYSAPDSTRRTNSDEVYGIGQQGSHPYGRFIGLVFLEASSCMPRGSTRAVILARHVVSIFIRRCLAGVDSVDDLDWAQNSDGGDDC